MSSSAIRAIVAGHGDFAAGIVSAVAQITGRGEELLALSNRGLGGQEIEALLSGWLDETSVGVVFVDLPAGSWALAARRVQRSRPGLTVVTGVNLAALLDFVMHDDAEEGAAHAVEKGRAALDITRPPRAG